MGVALSDVFDTLQVYLRRLLLSTTSIASPHLAGETSRPKRRSGPMRRRCEHEVRNATATWFRSLVVDIRDNSARSRSPLQTCSCSNHHRRIAARREHGRHSARNEDLADKSLSRSMAYEWTELSFLQKQSGKIEAFRDLQQNPFSALRSAWCSSSSCSPACTKAGRCRWP